ncbi:MAG: SDR family oxidoreductase [Acidimicrobiia bacterium]|nr:SDR family oxidoreductase [Acidimicrobiia bacterium]
MTRSRIAVVTGGGSGIGRGGALALSEAGWTVAVAGRRPEALDETVALLAGPGLAVPTDVADSASVEALFDTVVERFGRIDLLFNNAGTSAPPVPIDELDVDTWRRVVDVNLTGSFLCARAAFGVMRHQNPRGGRIINNGSISATTPRPFSAPYTATKHAITGLTKSLALDGRAFGIACGQLDIGNVASPMTEVMAEGVLQADGSTRPEPTMDMEAVARSLVHMASLPLDANVLFLTVMATTMPFVGRG